MKFVMPEPAIDSQGYLVYIPRSAIDLISGVITILSERRVYASEGDYERGYNVIAFIKACMLACPAERLLERVDSIYRLIDAANFGRVYTVVSEEPLEIAPDIPLVPDMSYELPGAIKQREDAIAKLEEIRSLIESGDADMDEILTLLVEIGGLLA